MLMIQLMGDYFYIDHDYMTAIDGFHIGIAIWPNELQSTRSLRPTNDDAGTKAHRRLRRASISPSPHAILHHENAPLSCCWLSEAVAWQLASVV